MKLAFFRHEKQVYRQPQPAILPEFPGIHFFALYRAARTGGDFYDFACIDGRVLTLFCDISGKRDQALDIAASLQNDFQHHMPILFSGTHINESERLSDLLLILNRSILKTADGPRYTPAFVSCFAPSVGTLTYVNAGHLPALMRDADGVSSLDANGLPLGLFTHSTHESQLRVLRPGSSLLLFSRGLVESKGNHEEFGMERVKDSLRNAQFENARELCTIMQTAAHRYLEHRQPDNDLTTLAIVRAEASAQAASG